MSACPGVFMLLSFGVNSLQQRRDALSLQLTISKGAATVGAAATLFAIHRKNTSSFAQIIRVHNSLNGLWFVVFEFFLVILAALWISYGGMMHGRLLISIVGIGISLNSLAVLVIAAVQIRNHEIYEGFLKMRSPEFRAALSREHPNLGPHTVVVMLSVLTPFLLLALLTLRTVKSSGDERG